SAVMRCERSASCAVITLKMPTCSFPSAAGQSVPSASTASSSASARPPRCHSRSTRTCCAMPVGSSSPTMATTRGPCSITSGTRTSSTRSGTPKWHLIASRIFGANWRRQARDRLPLDQLRALRLGLHRRLEVLDHGLKLLVRQLLERIAVLDLVLARHQQSEDLEIGGRLRPAHLRNGLFPMHGEIPQQRANYRLAQPITRAAQSSGRVALDEFSIFARPPPQGPLAHAGRRGIPSDGSCRAGPLICLGRAGDACVLGAVERAGNTLYSARVYVELGRRLAHTHAVRQSRLNPLSQ